MDPLSSVIFKYSTGMIIPVLFSIIGQAQTELVSFRHVGEPVTVEEKLLPDLLDDDFYATESFRVIDCS